MIKDQVFELINKKDLSFQIDWDEVQNIIESYFWKIVEGLPEEERDHYVRCSEENHENNKQIIQKRMLSEKEEAALNLLKQGSPFDLVQQILGPDIQLDKLIKKHFHE